MPPRLELQRSISCATRSSAPISTFLVPFLFSKQCRHISILSSISDNPGAYNKPIRRGRGPSSGKGKTSGRGHKGQKQHGKVPAGLTGGQTRLEVVKGIKGFKSPLTEVMSPINVDRIQEWIDQGRLDITKPITVRELQKSRCLHGVKDGVKLLARNANALNTPIHITVSRASDAAIAAIERAGGTVQTRYYTKSSIKRVLSGQTHPTQSLLSLPTTTPTPSSASRSTPTTPSSPIPSSSTPAEISALDTAALSHTLGYTVPPPQILSALPPPESYAYRLPDPTSRKDLEYYRDPAHRGYLAYQVGVGQGPSLFFRTPVQAKDLEKKERRRREKVKEGAKGLKGEGRLF